jgi:hypothetical protein
MLHHHDQCCFIVFEPRHSILVQEDIISSLSSGEDHDISTTSCLADCVVAPPASLSYPPPQTISPFLRLSAVFTSYDASNATILHSRSNGDIRASTLQTTRSRIAVLKKVSHLAQNPAIIHCPCRCLRPSHLQLPKIQLFDREQYSLCLENE